MFVYIWLVIKLKRQYAFQLITEHFLDFISITIILIILFICYASAEILVQIKVIPKRILQKALPFFPDSFFGPYFNVVIVFVQYYIGQLYITINNTIDKAELLTMINEV